MRKLCAVIFSVFFCNLVASATPKAKLLESHTYSGTVRPNRKVPEHSVRHPILVSHARYMGDFIPSNIMYYYPVVFEAIVLAPSGYGVIGDELNGAGNYKFRIINVNDVDIKCIITKRLCLDANKLDSCENIQQIFMIPARSNITDPGSFLKRTYIYNKKGEIKTVSNIIMEGCKDPSKDTAVTHIGTLTIS